MYFFSDTKLADALWRDDVSEKQQMIYLLIYVGIFSVTATNLYGHFVWSIAQELSLISLAYDVMLLGFTIGIIITTFGINAGGDGRHYIARYMCLSLPVIIKTLLFSLIAAIPVVLVLGVLMPEDAPVNDDITGLIFAAPFYLIAIWRYVLCFRIASGQKEL